MISFLLKEKYVYIKIYTNKIVIRSCGEVIDEVSHFSVIPFSTKRNLVGNFYQAESVIKKCLDQLFNGALLKVSPLGLVQGIDQSEGGYSDVEERVLLELAHGAGCRKVVAWHGEELSNDQVIEKIKSK